MMLNVFIVAAVLVVVKGDTLAENFYVKLKDLQNQYTSEIVELKRLNNEQTSLINSLRNRTDALGENLADVTGRMSTVEGDVILLQTGEYFRFICERSCNVLLSVVIGYDLIINEWALMLQVLL